MYDRVSIQRKCGCCGEPITITENNINDAIYYDKKTYHRDCFINMCKKRSTMKRKEVAQKWNSVLNNLNQIQSASNKSLYASIVKKKVICFIAENYDLTVISSKIYQRLNDIYNGSFKNMIHGIPPDHLLDMWKKKMSMLNQIALNNMSKGKFIDSENRVVYDLAILVNKYDSYKKWLERQKVIEAENNALNEEDIVNKSIDYIPQNMPSISKQNSLNNIDEVNSDDISDLVDDIFQ